MQCGPARTRERSSTRMPDSGPVTPQTVGDRPPRQRWGRARDGFEPKSRPDVAARSTENAPCAGSSRIGRAHGVLPPPAGRARRSRARSAGRDVRWRTSMHARRAASRGPTASPATSPPAASARRLRHGRPAELDRLVRRLRRLLEARRRAPAGVGQAAAARAGGDRRPRRLEGRRRRRAGQRSRAPTACRSATSRRRTSTTARCPTPCRRRGRRRRRAGRRAGPS